MWKFSRTAFALLAVIAAAVPASSHAGPAGEIRIQTKLRNTKGRLACALFASEEDWLKKPKIGRRLPLQSKNVVCVFSKVEPGMYAISFFHDENSNGELDTNLIGIPTEGFGTSRNAPSRFGPPDFEDAKFRHSGGVTRLVATTKYL